MDGNYSNKHHHDGGAKSATSVQVCAALGACPAVVPLSKCTRKYEVSLLASLGGIQPVYHPIIRF